MCMQFLCQTQEGVNYPQKGSFRPRLFSRVSATCLHTKKGFLGRMGFFTPGAASAGAPVQTWPGIIRL